jgi:hypothetical protein
MLFYEKKRQHLKAFAVVRGKTRKDCEISVF